LATTIFAASDNYPLALTPQHALSPQMPFTGGGFAAKLSKRQEFRIKPGSFVSLGKAHAVRAIS
jgi:hypothetical protein